MAEIFVGSVSVGVVPDAKMFSDDLRRQILPDAENIGVEFGRQMGQGIRDAVKVYIDEIKADLKKGLNTEVNVDTTKAKAEIDKTKAEVEGKSWTVRLHVDQESLRNLGSSIGTQIKRSIGNLALGGLIGTGLAAGGSALVGAAGPLAALTLGIGAFAAVAVPEITKTTTAMQKLGPAGQKAWKQLTPNEREIGEALKGLKNEFHDIQKELAPVIDMIVSMGIHTAKDLLPTLTMFARVGASILKSFLTPFDAWVKSKSFQVLASQFAMFGDAAGRILGPQIVTLLKALSRLFLQLLPTGLKLLGMLLPVITQLVIALTPGMVILATLATNTLKWVMAHHLLIPVLIATLAIIVIIAGPTGLGGIIAATLLVALVVGAFATHWRQWWADIKRWAQDAWNFLTHGWGQLLIPGLTIIRVTIEIVRDHWRQAWNLIKTIAEDAWNWLVHGWGRFLLPGISQIAQLIALLATHWHTAWNDIKAVASAVWDFIFHNEIQPMIHFIGTDLPNAFRTAVSIISRVWGTLKSIFSGPVSFLVNTVYDNGIARLWNDVMGAIHGPKLPVVHFSSGGRLGGYGGGDIVPALLEPGETVVSKEHSRVLAPMFAAAGVPGYQLGGIIHGAEHLLGGLFGGIGDVARIVAALTTGNATAAENAFAGLFHTSAPGELAQMMIGIPKAIVSTAVNFVIHSLDAITGGGGGAGIGGGVARWAGTVREVLALLGLPLADAGVVLRQMTTESGGNPTAVNLWDINAKEGHPSVGLMQVIAGTFDTYAGPFRNVGPFAYGVSENPTANIYAGVNYAEHAYGPGWVNVLGQGHGYDSGGWWPSGTFGLNTSGHSEYVLTHDMIGSMGGTSYHAHFDGVTFQSHEAMTRRAFQQMEIGRGRIARMGRRQ